jgi:tRNA pseudouridine38-40 synthase
MRLAIKFAYNGKYFHGYARQPKLRTVEGEIIKSITQHGIIIDLHSSFFRSSSRTDKGVSAIGNVIAINTEFPKEKILQKISNDFTDIIVYGKTEVAPDFNPRYAKLRHYRYYLKNNNYDIQNLISTSSNFLGKHNFSNFARIENRKNPVRSIDKILIGKKNSFIIFDFFAKNFLWQQIRRIMAAIIRVEDGKLKANQIIQAINKPNFIVDYGLAPPQNLILYDVSFDYNFEYDLNIMAKIKYLEKTILDSII